MKIGFTGSRKGMTISQWSRFGMEFALALEHGVLNEWHNGDAIGADHQANQTVDTLRRGQYEVETHGHPCNIDNQRAYDEFDIMHEVKPPLVRNRDIVNSSDLMFAAPYEYDEIVRGSGTWATIRYAKAHRVTLTIIWPDGSLEAFEGDRRLL
jgi:hypothetical protein